nr:hypothetical protein [Tanacetum cinerariifolium]
MSSASSAVTYNSVYTDSEPGMPHDPDYVPEPMYPEYIPLEDEHSQIQKRIQRSMRMMRQRMVRLTIPWTGEIGDDDDGNSSGDDADDEEEDEEDDEEEDEEDEGEEEHLASADSAIIIPNVELVSPREGTELVIPPPSTDTTTTGARITVRLQAAICLPPKGEVERLLAMPTPPPSPLTSLSPPSAEECLDRMASTQALIDAVTPVLPSPPLPPPLYIPPPDDHRDDIPETEMPPRKRLCLSTLGSRYEIGESFIARPTEGRGIDYGFASTLDAKAR